MSWNYNAEDYDPNAGGILPIGDYRVRIKEVLPRTSKTGKDMWELVLEVSGRNNKLWYYLVFMPENPKITNQNLGQIYDSFAITPSNMDFMSWVGKVGGARVKHDDFGAKVHYFLHRNQVDKLPPWQEPVGSGGGTAAPDWTRGSVVDMPAPPDDNAAPPPSDEDVPF